MELLQQHRVPGLFQRVVGVGGAGAYRRRGGPQLGLTQQVLAAPVAGLGAGLAGVGAAVELQVQLPGPDRRVRQLRLGRLEEAFRAGEPHRRRALQVRGARRGRQHLPRGPAAAVAPAERHQGGVPEALLAVAALRPGQFPAGELGVVGVHRREVREQAGAVDALPPEGGVRHGVRFVPGNLLGQEPAHAGGPGDLRQGRGVAERVRQPHHLRLHVEMLPEEPLPGRELPGQGLTAGHVRVRLHPHAPGGHEPSGADLLRDAGEQLRIVLPQPGVLLGGGRGEHEPRLAVHQLDDVGEGPGDLAHCFTHRPQPGAVDMGVPDGVDPVRARIRRAGQHPGQFGAARRGGAGDVGGVDGVHRPLQRAQDLVPARQVHGQFVHQPVQGPDVAGQVPGLHIQQGQLRGPEDVQGFLTRRFPAAQRRGSVGEAADDVRVGRRLQIEREAFAGGCVQRHVQVAGFHGLHHGSVGGVDQGLGLEARLLAGEAQVDHQLRPPAVVRRPLSGHGAGKPEPGGVPRCTPRGAGGEGPEVLGQRLREGDGLARGGPGGDVQRLPVPPAGRFEAFGQEPVDPGLDVFAVLVHRAPSLSSPR